MTLTVSNTTVSPISLADELAAVAALLSDSTVQVRTQQSASGGSGVIWQPDGLIVTNAHVATQERVTVELSDGRVFPAVRTSYDARRDLATLQIEASGLPAAPIGDSDALRVGELVLAVGHPHGFVGTLTTGIVHTITPSRQTNPTPWAIADIRLAPGNSGGPLANAQGQIVGINTMIAGGLALAVPSQVVERFLKEGSRPYLGVTMRPVHVRVENKHLLGLLILEVAFNSLAMAADLQIGDVLLGVCGQYFNSPDDLTSVLWHAKPGELLPIEFLRSGKRSQCTVNWGNGLGVTKPVLKLE